MKKTITLLLACLMVLSLLAACNSSTNPPAASEAASEASAAPAESTTPGGETPTEEVPTIDLPEGVIVKNGKLYFEETRKITVRLFDRAEGGTAPESNVYAQYIKDGVLRDHNIEVEFSVTARWGEDENIGAVLATQSAADVCVTYNYPVIQEYADQDAVIDMYPYITDYKDYLPNMWELLGETYLYHNKDPETGTVWAIEGIKFGDYRINSFAREDWMNKLNIPSPTNIDEFETMITAFKDNAADLLGSDADKMIPFGITWDVGWTAEHLLTSYVPDAITDREKYIYGFDDRWTLYPNMKEGYRKLNDFYNKGLIWKDFPLYGEGDDTFGNYMKAGYVGSLIGNWDYPYRLGGDKKSFQNHIQEQQGPDAAYVPILTFKNDAGYYRKYLPASVDRKVFFPYTNDEPLASTLYVDWISNFEVRKHLAIGTEGINHKVEADGTIVMLETTEATYDHIINSPKNIDYTITFNGLDLGSPELNARSMMESFTGTDPKYISLALEYHDKDAVLGKINNFGKIQAEVGKSTPLKNKRNAFIVQAIVAPTANFDKVWDEGMDDYMASGGAAIIEERTAAWLKYRGDVDWIEN